MPCINCYITWAQQLLPALLLPLALWLITLVKGPKRAAPPTYGPRWLPPFVRGILAAIRLGADEDAFLLGCNQLYGPVVYLPWPLGQYLVTDGPTIQRVYETSSKTLSFVPIRNSMTQTVFGQADYVCYGGKILEKRVYPIHARGLSKLQLEEPLSRFVTSIEEQLDLFSKELDSSEGGTTIINLVEFITNLLFEAGTPALFGPSLLSTPTSTLTPTELRQAFNTFDSAFPLLASGLIPPSLHGLVPPIAKGVEARNALSRHLGEWVRDGMQGLENGVVRDVAEIGLDEGLPMTEVGTLVLGTFWALQANGPFAATWLLLHLLQSPSLLPSLQSTISNHLTTFPTPFNYSTISPSTTLPLLHSTLFETLRLCSSSFSVRIVEEEMMVLECGENGRRRYEIPKGGKVVAATRVGHLSQEGWGEDVKRWDGERFLDREGEEEVGERSRKVKEVRAFGGGISVCEGRNLATAELKSVVALLLHRFDFEILELSPGTIGQTLKMVKGRDGIAPSVLKGRVGMGVFQFEGDVRVRVKKRVNVAA